MNASPKQFTAAAWGGNRLPGIDRFLQTGQLDNTLAAIVDTQQVLALHFKLMLMLACDGHFAGQPPGFGIGKRFFLFELAVQMAQGHAAD